MAYPTYPDTITRDTATSFATAYEEAYWHNWVVGQDQMAGTDSVSFVGPSVPERALIEHREGFIIGVGGIVRTADEEPPSHVTPGSDTPTPLPFADLPFSAWYYLTPEIALRKQREGFLRGVERPEPDLTAAQTIVCNR